MSAGIKEMSKVATDSVLNEIRRAHADNRTGILVLTNDAGQRVEVFFREGMIEAASSNLPPHRLGHYLQKQGTLSPRELDNMQTEAQRQNVSIGEAIVRKRLLNQIEVASAVRSQAVELLVYVFSNGFSVESFTGSLRSYYAPARITYPHVLLEHCRSTATPFQAEFNGRIVLADGVDLTAFPWRPDEMYVLSELRHPNTYDGLLNVTGITDANLRKTLGVFAALGVIETMAAQPADDSSAVVKAEFEFEHLIPVVTNAVLNEKLEVAKNNSFTSEQFKNLKVHLSEATSKAPLKVFTISSPDPQDGKSLISANLAFSFAMDPGRRAIIVDCDLRSPSLEKYLGVSSEPGLLQYLGNGHLSPCCYVRRLENLYFMTAGGTAPNPIEILSMHKMRQLVEHLKRYFDTVILDAPPYSPIADARVVTGLSDALIMVLRRGKTTYGSTDRAFKAIDRNKLLGVVFNDVQPMLFHTYYSSNYYHHGGKGYVYSAEDPKVAAKPKHYLGS